MRSELITKAVTEIFNHGFSFTRPLANYSLEASSHSSWRYYILSLKHRDTRNYEKALIELEKSLNTCKSRSLYYILLAHKLSLLGLTKRYREGVDLYKKLRSEIKNIPPNPRRIVAQLLLNYCSMHLYDIFSCIGRFSGKMYEMNEATNAFVLISKARYDARKGDVEKAIEQYKKALELSKSIPHPAGILSCLNDIAWFTKERNSKVAIKYAEEAMYWNGYFSENPKFYVLDTLFVVQNMVHDAKIFKTSKLLLLYLERLPEEEYVRIYKRYEKTIKKAKKMLTNSEKALYKNTKEFRNYLRRHVKSIRQASKMTGIAWDRLRDIMYGKVSTIKGTTLRKLITGLNLDPFTAPNCVATQWWRTMIEKKFLESLELLDQMRFEERIKDFLLTYMSMPERETTCKYLSRKDKLRQAITFCGDVKAFKEFMSQRHETMEFVVDMVDTHPYIEGRKAVVKKAIEKMGIKRLKEFIQRYIELDESDRKLLDRFMRNYGRYDGIRFGLRVKGPKVVREFARRYRLKILQPMFLAYWCEDDGRVRRRLERVLKSMVGTSPITV